MTPQLFDKALSENFAPWVQALGLRLESCDENSVVLRLPQQAQLARIGGMVCGQALMAAADTCMVFALMHHWGELRPCTTVQMNSCCRNTTPACRRAARLSIAATGSKRWAMAGAPT